MKKYMLLVTCSLLIAGSANALTANEQLKALKEAYIKSFNKIDSNQDGLISKSEYLTYQFEDLRANIIDTDGFEDEYAEKETTKGSLTQENTNPQAENKNNKSLDLYSKTIEEMANYDMDIDDELSQDLGLVEYEPLTKEDVMPDVVDEKNLEALKLEPADELTEKTKEDVELDALITDTESQISALSDDNITSSEQTSTKDEETSKTKETANENNTSQPEETAPNKQEDKISQINTMLETVKKTLPQKIDEVTTWTDILYENGIISYIYQADIDISLFSEEEKVVLRDSIKSEACEEIFKSVCPQALPLFIEKGTNMTLRYVDRNNNEISFCELNKETCTK